jgi:hypothetical protein
MNTNAPEESVRSILDESAAYYLLGVQVSNSKPDGRFRPITVKVNRPDVEVLTRKGYYAESVATARSSTAAQPSLEAVASGLLPERHLPMSVTAAPFRGPKGTPVLVITTGVRGGNAPTASTRQTADTSKPDFEPVEFLMSAFRNSDKTVEWHRQRLAVSAPERPPGQLRYEAISTLAVKPGRYEVRVAARHGQAPDVGSVHTYVDVPDFASDRLTVSGAVLFDRRAPTATPPTVLAGVLDASPTTRREFTAADEITVLVRVYQRAAPQLTAVNVFFHIFDEKLQEVGATERLLETVEFAKTAAAGARFPVPLETLRPGAYVMQIGVTGGPVLRRDVRFTVK